MSFRVDVLTLFPDVVERYADATILGRARERGVWRLETHDIRDATDDAHRTVDDSPFGGGAGMVMKAEPIVRTVESIPDLPRPLIAVTPSGRPFTQQLARELASGEGFSVLCGRYEGFDQRALDMVADQEVSLGDFVLAGGELAALCIVEAAVRLRPGALGNDESSLDESFGDGLLEYPHYTKPADFRGFVVPEVLRSGDHGRIARWRRAAALQRTKDRRPDLFANYVLTSDDERALREFPLS